jgi:rod shape-determining protein MreC
MLIGKADTVLVENARVLALDLASPALEAIARPVAVANRAIADLKEFATLREENARLREENARLLAWQTAARRLENENDRLRELSQFREGPEASFITARIVGDSVSAYVRGALLNVGRKVGRRAGPGGGDRRGPRPAASPRSATTAPRAVRHRRQFAHAGAGSSGTRERAILAGDNSNLMRLTLAQTVQGIQRATASSPRAMAAAFRSASRWARWCRLRQAA